MDNNNINSRSLPQLNNFKPFSFSSFVIQQHSQTPISTNRFENKSVRNLKESSLLGRKCFTPLVCFPQSHETHTQTISPQKLNKSCEAIPYLCLQEVQTELSFDSYEWQTELKISGNNTGNDYATQTEEFSQTLDDLSANRLSRGKGCDRKSRNKSIFDSKNKSKTVIKNGSKKKNEVMIENEQNNNVNQIESVNQCNQQINQNTVNDKKKVKVKCCIH